MAKLVDWIIERAQRTPYFHLEGYMERWWLFRLFPMYGHYAWLSARVHHILRSDYDRALHDHPWWYITIILKGGYWEVTPKGTKWYGPGRIRFARAKSQHRLVVPKGEDAWTLFIHGPKSRDWGFQISETEWVYWKDYVDGQN